MCGCDHFCLLDPGVALFWLEDADVTQQTHRINRQAVLVCFFFFLPMCICLLSPRWGPSVLCQPSGAELWDLCPRGRRCWWKILSFLGCCWRVFMGRVGSLLWWLTVARERQLFPDIILKEAVRSFRRMIESPRSPGPRHPYDPMSAIRGENGYGEVTNRIDREVKFEPEVARCVLTVPPTPFCCSTSDFLKGTFPSPDLSPQQGLGICVSFLGLL